MLDVALQVAAATAGVDISDVSGDVSHEEAGRDIICTALIGAKPMQTFHLDTQDPYKVNVLINKNKN